MYIKAPKLFDKTPFSVTADRTALTVYNPCSSEITGMVKANLNTADFPENTLPASALCSNGEITPIGIYRLNSNCFSVCFPASIAAGEHISFTLGNESADTPYPYDETIKTSEGDYHHITASDNGTLIISDKSSGSIYFEMPTFILSAPVSCCCIGTKAEAYATNAKLCKYSSPVHTVFSSVIPLGFPDSADTDITVRSQVFHGKGDHELLFSAQYGTVPEGMSLTLRLPTGIAFPAVSLGTDSPELLQIYGNRFEISEKLKLVGDDGTSFSVTVTENVLASVSRDGNIDITLPENGLGDFEYMVRTN